MNIGKMQQKGNTVTPRDLLGGQKTSQQLSIAPVHGYEKRRDRADGPLGLLLRRRGTAERAAKPV